MSRTLCGQAGLRARKFLLACAVVALSVVSPGTNAEPPRVAKWMDADGVVQFGHPQFAPAEHEAVSIQPANGMEPASYTDSGASRNGPVVHQLERNHVSNRRGFRGHYNRRNQGTRNR